MDETRLAAPNADGELAPPRGLVEDLARCVLRDPASAADLEPEAWPAGRRAPADRVRRPAGWMSTVLRNLALRELRTRPRREALPSAADEVARRDVERRLGRAVEEPGEPYRSVVRLRLYEERPPREIARLLQRPLNTVSSPLKRGLQKLRERLDEEPGDRTTWSALLLPLAARDGAGALARWTPGSSSSGSPGRRASRSSAARSRARARAPLHNPR